MKRHGTESFFVVGEGVFEFDRDGNLARRQPSTIEELRRFRFSRLGPVGGQTDEAIRIALAAAITADVPQPDSAGPPIPAGFTYLGQFVDHDLTMDRTATQLGEDVTVEELLQGRSPALDLDSLYGRGPQDPGDRVFYNADGVTLKVGTTSPTNFPDERVNVEMEGFDLPRLGAAGGTAADRRRPLIPDIRNDENLAVAQTHLAFMRFHNRVAETLAMTGLSGHRLFRAARELVVRHYQWMLITDFLPRIIDPAIVTDVFRHGRRFFEAPGQGCTGHGLRPTMPIEFSVAAYRLGHSMIRGAYEWNRVFNSTGPGPSASLLLLFTFSGVSGNFQAGSQIPDLDNPNSGTVDRLPTNWIADFRRLYDFTEAARPDLVPPVATGGGNVTKRIDTLLVNPLNMLPAGAFGGRGTTVPDIHRNLAFRNLTRAHMVRLASGQQMAEFFGVEPLTREQILLGNQGANLDALTDGQRSAVAADTPLWFYILREAEFNNGLLGAVGGRIVAEVFHRAIEGSRTSIVREPAWRPTLGPDTHTFRMTDLLLFAFEGKADLLNPLGD
ncbi:heme peroxidase family protein [Nocardia sp. CDC159]|uniref:Heme peroxidase family protein n=1 Tax=Nocardia pulmonis TaxID=2951408 RepID=A0A9X2E9E1_9NOCA|nr:MULTISPECIES: heme peroxidase family protein [Nocardia]MCM6775260.1 heme peroxidase family protein [Nocardia pulmonis]MCM6788006.1 heme peroxidase family protein [Nocardia sp. CDC159]